MDIEERIEAAIERITCGFAPMRVPADGTDPDLVLADCLTEIRLLRAAAGPHIPEGYVLVPVEPTEAMLDAGAHALPRPTVRVSAYGEGTWTESRPWSENNTKARAVMVAMIAARPEAP